MSTVKNFYYRFRPLAWGAALLAIGVAHANDVPALSVGDLITQVLETNPELAIYEAEIEAAHAEKRQAGRRKNPVFSLEGGHLQVREDGGAGTVEGLTWAASIEQSIEFPGRLALRKAIANANQELAELGLAHFRRRLAYRVRELAAELHAARTEAEAAEQVAVRAMELTEAVLQRETGGITPLLESRVLESSRISLQHRRMQAWQRYQRVLIELNQLRNLPAETPVRIEEPITSYPRLPPIPELVTRAWTESFDAVARQMELAQQGFRVQLAENERYPSISIAPYVSQDNAGERETVVGVGVSFPLPLWDRNTDNIHAARARERQAQATLLVLRRDLERQVVEQALAYQAAREALNALQPESLEKLAEAADLAERHFRLGALPVGTYLELQTAYLDALESLMAIRRDALQSRLGLELLTGSFTESEMNQ